MKLLKLAAFAVAVVLTATIAGGLAYLQTADLGGLLTSQLRQRTGMVLTAEGPITLKVLPAIRFQASKVRLAGTKPNENPLTFDEANVHIQWGSLPFFWQGLTVAEVTLTNPTLTVHKYADGTTNYTLPTPKAETDKTSATASSQPFALPAYKYGTVTITNLNALYQDDTQGKTVKAQGINFTVNGQDITKTLATLAGMVNGQPVQARAEADLHSLKEIPLDATLQAAGLSAAVKGTVMPGQNGFDGQVQAQTANLQATLQSLLGKAPEGAAPQPFALKASLTNQKGTLNVHQAEVTYGQLLQASAEGNVTYQGTLSAKGHLQAQGSNLKNLLATLGKPQPMAPASPFKLSADLSGQNAITLNNATFEVPGVIRVGTDAVITPGHPTLLKGTVRMAADNLAATLKALGQNRPAPTAPLAVETNVIYGQNSLILKGVEGSLGQLVKLTADLTLTPQPLNLEGTLTASGDNMAALAKGFGVTGGNIPATPFKVATTLQGGKSITASPLSIQLPGMAEADGKVTFTPGTTPSLSASLSASRLNLTSLGICKASSSAASIRPTSASMPARGGAGAPWSDKPLNVAALKGINFDVKIQVKSFTCANAPYVDSLQATLKNGGGKLQITELQAGLPQNSTASVSGQISYADTPQVNITAKTTAVPLQEIVPILKQKGAILPLTTTMNLNASGKTTRQMAQSLSGSLEANAQNATFPFKSMLGNAALLDKVLTGQGLEAATNAGSGGDTVTASYEINHGVATAKTLKIASGDGSMDILGTGTINLPEWQINTTLTPSLHGQKGKIEVPVLISGNLTSPTIGPDPAFLQRLTTRLTGQALNKALGLDKGKSGAVGEALGGVLSGQGITAEGAANLVNSFTKKKDSPSPTTTAPTQDELIQQGVGNLIKAFGN